MEIGDGVSFLDVKLIIEEKKLCPTFTKNEWNQWI